MSVLGRGHSWSCSPAMVPVQAQVLSSRAALHHADKDPGEQASKRVNEQASKRVSRPSTAPHAATNEHVVESSFQFTQHFYSIYTLDVIFSVVRHHGIEPWAHAADGTRTRTQQQRLLCTSICNVQGQT